MQFCKHTPLVAPAVKTKHLKFEGHAAVPVHTGAFAGTPLDECWSTHSLSPWLLTSKHAYALGQPPLALPPPVLAEPPPVALPPPVAVPPPVPVLEQFRRHLPLVAPCDSSKQV